MKKPTETKIQIPSWAPVTRFSRKTAGTLRGVILAVLVTGLFATPLAKAQNYAINWSRIAGGGGTSTNGPYSLSGTIGQHDAGGPMTNGTFSLTGGFWALYAVPTPGAPLLRIFLTTTNTAVVAWPAPSTGWTLQSTTNLAAQNWTAVAGTVVVAGSENYFIVAPPVGNLFYRLSHP